ncbi:RluA family pseudouridine synthase [bacterium]|nr:RluA family pseudouridine synthase [bacterium]
MINQTYKFNTKSEGPSANVIAEGTGLSKSLVKKLMTFGAVWINKKGKTTRLRSHKKVLTADTKIEVYHDEKILTSAPPSVPEILFEGDQFDVWYKPQGWLSQGTQFGDKYSLLRVAEVKRNKSFLIHRLDREVAGIMVVAATSKVANYFSERWNKKSTRKFYQAEVMGKLESLDTLVLESDIDEKESRTVVSPVRYGEDSTFLEIEIKTGRKHQIRIHLDEAGHPVLGDPAYGTGNKNSEGMKLVATRLILPDPKTRHDTMEFTLPEELHLFS